MPLVFLTFSSVIPSIVPAAYNYKQLCVHLAISSLRDILSDICLMTSSKIINVSITVREIETSTCISMFKDNIYFLCSPNLISKKNFSLHK